MNALAWIPALPLLGFVVNGAVALASSLQRARRGEGGAPLPYGERLFHGLVGVGTVGASGVLAFAALVPWAKEAMGGGAVPVVQTVWRWMYAGDFSVDVAFRLDALSALMLAFVTFVGTLIHLYSVGYLQEEEGYGRYFAFLNLFMFAMLTLVLGANLPVLFIGWEGVGLCSYLLIGYYYDKDFAVAAGKKAFITNRVGDVGFVLGIFGVLALFGTTDFSFLEAAKHQMLDGSAPLPVYVVCLLLFLGACGKSAQVPLYVWLPDAMAGPTPVSALIHAATMVTAGVYLVARMSAVFVLAPDAMTLVAWIGAGTAIFAASIGLAQNDIKKVLAYSTVSQLGYMFLACGVGAFAAGMFHVFTHAFFKACLFLGSGSVIQAMHHEQDMRRMGGLAGKLPQTYRTMLAASLAICGIVPFAGFFSKDMILGETMAAGHPVLWGVGVAAAAMTAFYMFRLMRMTFAGDFRGTHEQEHHLRESPPTMTVPLWVLASGSLLAGFIWVPFGVSDLLPRFLAPSLAEAPVHEMSHGSELTLMAVSLAAAAAGIWLAVRWYTGRPAPAHAAETPVEEVVVSPAAAAFCEKRGLLGRLVRNKWNVDEGIERGILGPFREIGRVLWKGFDALLIDGIANASAFLVELSGDLLRFFTTGNVRNYALTITLGTLALVAYILFR
jgi:NADH-quinone oxidoreductase subunit L